METARPIIILGAGRSGTNLLRDLLCTAEHWGTWPCDEINYIWRHGNKAHPTDEFTRDMATEPISKFIRDQVFGFARKSGLDVIVEKTCANSLRPGFVDSVLPEATFVHLIRDGRDVALSASKRWKAQLDLPYIAKKARYVPLSDLPYYGFNYAKNRLQKISSQDDSLAWWGPKCDYMDTWRANDSIELMCAKQWQRCVELTTQQLKLIDASRQYQVSYEQLVSQPKQTLQSLGDFIDLSWPDGHLEQLTTTVSDQSVGQWKHAIPTEVVKSIHQAIDQTLQSNGYHID